MYTYKYPHPAVTADCIVFAHDGDDVLVLLIQRLHDPFCGCWAFPGGFMNIDETAEAAAVRELEEETGLKIASVRQVGAFSRVDRDPRERVVTVAFYAELPSVQSVKPGDDAGSARWFSLKHLPSLAFDHSEIIEAAYSLWSSALK